MLVIIPLRRPRRHGTARIISDTTPTSVLANRIRSRRQPRISGLPAVHLGLAAYCHWTGIKRNGLSFGCLHRARNRARATILICHRPRSLTLTIGKPVQYALPVSFPVSIRLYGSPSPRSAHAYGAVGHQPAPTICLEVNAPRSHTKPDWLLGMSCKPCAQKHRIWTGALVRLVTVWASHTMKSTTQIFYFQIISYESIG